MMKILSSAFGNNQSIPAEYTCDGKNINPPLEIVDAPKSAKGLVLIMDDPDAPMGTWVHWVVWNINPQMKNVAENSVPEGGIQGRTNRENSYGGPCPPSGTHRYFFKLFALDIILDLPSSAGKAELEKAMAGHIIESAELIGLYNRV